MGIRRAEGVTFEPSGDSVVILDADGSVITTLNAVGTVIWHELDGERDVAALARDLSERFEGVSESELEADIAEFVASLADAALVTAD